MAARSVVAQREALVAPVLAFLGHPTPQAWIEAAADNLELLLLDHASLELKAAQQAQTLIRRYGASTGPGAAVGEPLRLTLVRKLSRLAREELRHFEQVVELLAAREIAYEPVTASRYARTLHERVRESEPARCIDTLIVGAIIEARSCERFYSLLPVLETTEPELATFYASLLRSEARHYEDYLGLARAIGDDVDTRVEELLAVDAALVTQVDSETRFHSGPPAT